MLRSMSELPCLVLSLALIVVAWVIGRDFQQYVDQGIVVGEDDARFDSGGGSGAATASSSGVKVNEAQRTLLQQSTKVTSFLEPFGYVNFKNLPVRDGRRPGDVGYGAYDMQLWDGVFDDEDEDEKPPRPPHSTPAFTRSSKHRP